MNRRTVLRSAIATGLLAGGTPKARGAQEASAQPASMEARARGSDFIDTADGVKIAFADWGKGRPVVFVHAWALPSPMWDYQVGALAREGMRCITYDRRGHGRSGKPRSGYDCDTLADDLSALLTELDLNEVTLVSHSFGSAEIVRYLTRHGAGRVAKIVLIAPAALPFVMKTEGNPGGVPEEQLEFFRARVLQVDFPKWLEDGKKAFFLDHASACMQDWIKGLMLTTPLPVAMETNRQVTSTDFRRELAGITVPTLIIHGDKDASAPIELTGRPATALIPNAELRVYEGAPHGIFLTHKDRLNADLKGFIMG
jgi:non-heme chloroperoxidase